MLSPIIPFAIPLVLALMIWKKSVSHLFENNPGLYILAFGMVNTKITNKLVVSISVFNKEILLLVREQ